jgi:hypothetical protein
MKYLFNSQQVIQAVVDKIVADNGGITPPGNIKASVVVKDGVFDSVEVSFEGDKVAGAKTLGQGV